MAGLASSSPVSACQWKPGQVVVEQDEVDLIPGARVMAFPAKSPQPTQVNVILDVAGHTLLGNAGEPPIHMALRTEHLQVASYQ